jgi:ribosome-interacting GTPase 1
MPANLPPQYFEVERKLKTARTSREKIAIYEELLAIIPKHKGTEKLQAQFKSKIAKLRQEAERKPAAAKHGSTVRVEKSGAGQVAVIGAPNAGKSSIIRALTGHEVEVAEYPYTTRTAAPFMMPFADIQIQLIDTPPIAPDFIEVWLPELIKTADAVMVAADLSDLDASSSIEGVLAVLKEKRIELVPQAQPIPPEKFPFLKHALLAGTHLDAEGAAAVLDEIKVLFEGRFGTAAISTAAGQGVEALRKAVFNLLKIVRVYSKAPGKKADLTSPFTLKIGSTVMDLARAVHKDFALNLAFARIWSRGGSLEGLRVQREHVLADEDVVELHL